MRSKLRLELVSRIGVGGAGDDLRPGTCLDVLDYIEQIQCLLMSLKRSETYRTLVVWHFPCGLVVSISVYVADRVSDAAVE